MIYRQLAVVTAQHHQARRFKPYSNWLFAREEMAVEVVVEELGNLLTAYPLCFMRQPEGPVLAALLSVLPQRNCYVAPSGQWSAPYVPALLRAYPFGFVQSGLGESAQLCIDEHALLPEGSAEGIALFDETGQPSDYLKNAHNFVLRFAADQQRTRRGVAQIDQAGLLAPWPIEVQDPQGQKETLGGLWRINETALQQLPPAVLSALCASGALSLAYAQLLSQSRIGVIQRLVTVHGEADEKKQQLDTQMKNLFDEDNGSITFDF